jgi:ATP-binding cassette subfamily B protein
MNRILNIIKVNTRVFASQWHFAPKLGIGLFLTSALMALIPFFESKTTELVINSFIKASDNQLAFIALFVIAYTLPTFIYSFKGYLETMNYIVLQEKWDLAILRKRLDIDIATYEKSNFQNLVSKIKDRGIYPLVNASDRMFPAVQNVLEIIISMVITISFDWRYMVAIFVGALPKFIIELVYGRSVWGIWDAEAPIRKRFWDLQGYFQTTIGLVDLRLYQSGNYLVKWVEKLVTTFTKKQRKGEAKKTLFQILTGLVSAMAYAFIVISLVKEAKSGTILVGSLIFILASIRTFENAFAGLLLNIAKQYKDLLFAMDIFTFMDAVPVIENKGTLKIAAITEPPVIRFENVSFTYAGHTAPTLRNLNLEIRPGEKVALVGNNGAGKTTFVKLLCRVYDPTEGKITINGKDLREYDLDEWWSILGVLFQDYTTYNFTVKESIAMGRADSELDLAKITESALQSEAHEFIEKWEEKYDQPIGVDFAGVEPSRGQRQKLSLARVWYRDPKIFILDEPTASVDAESEQKIFEKIETMSKLTTAILISHRFSTVKKADKICVMEQGLLKEVGTHSELMALNGTYARLFDIQAKGYSE